MTTITLSIGNFSASMDVTEEEGARIIAGYRKIFSQVPNANGKMRAMTPQEVVERIATDFINKIAERVRLAEQREAIKNARAGIPRISPRPRRQ